MTNYPDSVICPHCKNEVDLEICHCGEDIKHHDAYLLGHSFVPMGCACGYAKEEVVVNNALYGMEYGL